MRRSRSKSTRRITPSFEGHIRVNAKASLRELKLRCKNLTGTGLAPLEGSTTLTLTKTSFVLSAWRDVRIWCKRMVQLIGNFETAEQASLAYHGMCKNVQVVCETFLKRVRETPRHAL